MLPSLIGFGLSVLCSTHNHRPLAATTRNGDEEARLPPITCRATRALSRVEAAILLDEHILPSRERGRRIALGNPNKNINKNAVAWDANDPILFETYGEFPLSSLDLLLDRAEEIWNSLSSSSRDDQFVGTTSRRATFRVVDVGSGCGRLAMYLALTRPDWDVVGIELAPHFHREAIDAVQRATDRDYMQHIRNHTLDNSCAEDVTSINSFNRSSRLVLYCGPAQDYAAVLQEADLIFCYSTAFQSVGFSEESCAMLLSDGWSSSALFGCVGSNSLCITTDKALNPYYGWRILDRMNVPNPEVFESTGFIQQRLPNN